MDPAVLWRASAVQAAGVALLFALLIAAPLPEGFFREYGWATGPIAWLLCSIVTARVVRLPAAFALLCALASGAAAAAIGLVLSHTVGLVAGVALFGVLCSLQRRTMPRAAI